MIPGAYTFKDGAQYLVAESDQCSGSALYRFDGFDSRVFLECVEVPGRIVQTVGGFKIRDAIYLTDKTQRVYLMQWSQQHLTYVDNPWNAYSIKDSAMEIDGDYAVVGNNTGLKLYDLTDALDPVLITSILDEFNRVTISYPLVMAGIKGFVNSERMFDVSSGAFVPVEFDVDTHPDSQCAEFQSGEFVQGGDAIILNRYSYGEMFEVTAPPDPTPTPVPDLIFRDGFESGDTSRWE